MVELVNPPDAGRIQISRGAELFPAYREMWRDRPQEISKEIDRRFDILKNNPPKYISHGRDMYTFNLHMYTSDDIISALFSPDPKRHYTILDVGAGTGAMSKKIAKVNPDKDITLNAVSAYDYRSQDYPIEGINYLAPADAENIANYYSPNSQDLIISNLTMVHLVDPLGTIAQMYEILAPEGLMVLDSFSLPGINDKLPSLIQFLREQGYEVSADYEYRIRGESLKPQIFHL